MNLDHDTIIKINLRETNRPNQDQERIPNTHKWMTKQTIFNLKFLDGTV